MTSSDEVEILPYVSKPWFTKGPEQIEKDMESLAHEALGLGATRATVIPTDKIVVDERCAHKCWVPPCVQYGVNLMCPPYAPKPSQTKEMVNKYKKAILIRKEFDPNILVPGYVILPPEESARAITKFRMYEHDINVIVNRIEGEAYHLGYYLALGYGAGTCFWCGLKHLSPDGSLPLRVPCEGLKTGVCSAIRKARPSMEACSIDVFATTTNAGWPIYVIGQRSDPAKIDCAGAHGLVLIY